MTGEPDPAGRDRLLRARRARSVHGAAELTLDIAQDLIEAGRVAEGLELVEQVNAIAWRRALQLAGRGEGST